MVSWDLKVKFLGVSPNVKELVKLAEQEKFSNIENLEWLRNEGSSGIFRLEVNNRATEQTEFKVEIVKED